MATAEEIRQRFPNAIALADEVRDVFGDGVKLIYLREGNTEYGVKDPESGTWIQPNVIHQPEKAIKNGRK